MCWIWVLICVLFVGAPHEGVGALLRDHSPVATAYNPHPYYCLINSVDCHPHEELCCVAYTQANAVVLYRIDSDGRPAIVQTLGNPAAVLREPQHAVFSPSGDRLVVANWSDQTLNIYRRRGGNFQSKPAAVIPRPEELTNHRPHGIAFSPDGKYFAVAYGATPEFDKAVGLFCVRKGGLDMKLIDLVEAPHHLPGTPKGVAFSPDGTCLLVTFCDSDCLAVYALSDGKIVLPPRQVIAGEESQIFRPEDVKVSLDGTYCAVTNSDHSTVTFYPFDAATNLITQAMPCEVLQNPEANADFPHGLAFLSGGRFLLVTAFGQVNLREDGYIVWEPTTPPALAKMNIYRLDDAEE